MRLIDADALIAKAYIMQEPNGFIHSVVTERQIVAAPTIEAEPVRHGRWVDAHKGLSACKCTICGSVRETETNYCPNCGAKMDGDSHD